MIMDRKHLLLSLAIALCIVAFGCEKDCTEIGCIDYLNFTLKTPITPSASVVILLSFDGTDRRCEFEVGERTSLSRDCDHVSATWEDGTLTSFGSTVLPERLNVTLLEDEETLLSGEFEPEYEIIHPNGVECPPECRFATIQL